MAQRQKSSRSSVQDADSMESLKPLIVLGLLGTIMYGAYSVVQKGPTPPSVAAATSAVDAPHNGPPLGSPPLVAPPPMAPPAPPTPAMQAAATAAPVSAPTSFEPPPAQPSQAMAPAAAPTVPPPPEAFPPADQSSAQPTYLSAQSAAPPMPSPPQSDSAAQVPSALSAPPTPGRAATLASAGAAMEVSPPPLPPLGTAGQPQPASPSPAFTAAWADAHEKLAAGRYAEALAVLSVWYDDPSLGPEESQRQEDLLGRLAGTVIYSQQDHLLPPCIVAPGEDLQSIAAPLSVPWQLLAKINGVADPSQLVPGEHLKVVRGPFDAVISVSRRRLSLQVGGNYAGSFPVVIGRQIHDRIGASIPVLDVRRGVLTHDQPSVASQVAYNSTTGKKLILLGEGMSLEAVEDISLVTESAPGSSLVVSTRDLDELLDILGPGSQVLVRR